MPAMSRRRVTPWLDLALLLGILCVGFALRTYLLGAQNLWWDEGLAVWAVRKGLVGMTLWTASDVHPPLFFWGLFALTRVAGEGEFAARFPSVIYGLLTIPLAYQLGRRLVGRRVGLLAALLVALSRFHVWWSQEMRMYMLAGLLGTASLYFMVRWWQQERDGAPRAWRGLIPYVLASAGALYTLYLSILIIVVQNAFLLIAGLQRPAAERWRVWRRWLVGQVITALLFVPWLLLALPRMQTWSTSEPFRFASFIRLYLTALTLGISTHVERYTWLVGLFALLCVAGALLAWKRGQGDARRALLLLALCLGLPPLAVYFLTMPRGLFYSPHVEARYLLPFAPPFYLLLAWSIQTVGERLSALLGGRAVKRALTGERPAEASTSIASRLLGASILAAVLVVFTWSLPQHYDGRYLRDELQSLVRTISAYAEPGDAVCLISGDRYPIWDYYYHDPEREGLRPTVYYLPQGTSAITAENVAAQLAPLTAQHRRIWLAYFESALQDPQALAQGWLRERNNELYAARFDHNSLWLYADEGPLRVAEPAFPQHVPALGLPPQPNLVGYDLPTAEFRPGDTVRLALYWEPAAAAQVAVSLRDGQGRVLEARDLALDTAAGLTRTEAAFPIYPGTPAGAYHFQVDIRAGEQGTSSLQLGALRVTHTTPPPRPPQMAQPVGADLGGVARLEGYTLRVQGQRAPAAAIHAGDTLELTLYWRAPAKIEARYTVFTHLLGAAYNPATSGPVWAQHDAEPQDGGLPTTQWFPGEMVPDRHLLAIDAQAPAGGYELEVGLYDTMTGARLPVAAANGQAAGDRVLLGTWTVQERKR